MTVNAYMSAFIHDPVKDDETDVVMDEWIKEHYIKRDKVFGVIALAKRFNVHRKTIGRIVNGQSWKEGDAKCQG